jgi:acylphosphatase
MGTRALVSGRVQGVGFRWAAALEAERLGVHGTIVNLADGRVEAVLDGSGPEVDALLQWLRRGPRWHRCPGSRSARRPTPA